MSDRFKTLNEHNWSGYIPAPMSRADEEAFQRQLDILVPPEPDGTKRLKLVWNPSTEVWDVALRRYRPYLLWRFREPDEVTNNGVITLSYEAIGVPRYIILGKTAEEAREIKRDEFFSEDGNIMENRREAEDYIRIVTICEHSDSQVPNTNTPKCCHELVSTTGKKCFGEYRPPDRLDLHYLIAKFEQNRHLLGLEPGAVLSDEQKIKLYSMSVTGYQRQQRFAAAESAYVKKSLIEDPWFDRDNLSAKGKISIPN